MHRATARIAGDTLGSCYIAESINKDGSHQYMSAYRSDPLRVAHCAAFIEAISKIAYLELRCISRRQSQTSATAAGQSHLKFSHGVG